MNSQHCAYMNTRILKSRTCPKYIVIKNKQTNKKHKSTTLFAVKKHKTNQISKLAMLYYLFIGMQRGVGLEIYFKYKIDMPRLQMT